MNFHCARSTATIPIILPCIWRDIINFLTTEKPNNSLALLTPRPNNEYCTLYAESLTIDCNCKLSSSGVA